MRSGTRKGDDRRAARQSERVLLGGRRLLLLVRRVREQLGERRSETRVRRASGSAQGALEDRSGRQARRVGAAPGVAGRGEALEGGRAAVARRSGPDEQSARRSGRSRRVFAHLAQIARARVALAAAHFGELQQDVLNSKANNENKVSQTRAT